MANKSGYVVKGQQQQLNMEQQQQPQQKQAQGWQSVEMEDTSYQTEYDMHMQMDQRVKESTRDGKDSESMQWVKQAMAQLTDALNTEIDPDVKKFKLQCSNIAQRYQVLIDACTNYQGGHRINLTPSGRERSRMVAEVKARAMEERMHFADVGSALKIHEHRVNGMIMGNVLGGVLVDYRSIKVGFEIKDCDQTEDGYTRELEDEEAGQKWDCFFEPKRETLSNQCRAAVSMSRMMEFLGVGGLCQKSEVALAKDEKGNRFFGVRTEKWRHEQDTTYEGLQELMNEEQQNGTESGIEFSARAVRELSAIQLMRMLAGAEDPNSKEGIRLSYAEKPVGGKKLFVVTSVYMDAGDTVFSTLKPKQYEKKGKNGKTLKAADLPVVDTETAAAILAMRAEDFKFLTADMLSKQQQEAFAARLVWLQKQLTERIMADRSKPDDQRTTFRAKDWEDRRLRSNLAKRCQQSGNLFPEMLNAQTRIEDSGTAESSPEEDLYNRMYTLVKDKVTSAASPKEALWVLTRFITACESDVMEGVCSIAMKDDLATRLVNELMSESMLKAFVQEKYEASKRIVEAYQQKAPQVTTVPPEFYNQEKFDEEVRLRVDGMRTEAKKSKQPFDEEAAKKKAEARMHEKVKEQYTCYLLQKENQKYMADIFGLNGIANALALAYKNATGNYAMNDPMALFRKYRASFGKRMPGGWDAYGDLSENGENIYNIISKFDLLNKDAVKDVEEITMRAYQELGRQDIAGVLPG